MNTQILLYFMSLLLLTLTSEEPDSAVDDTEEVRQPRVNGRIVKLYSGPKPDPVYCSEEGFQADPINCAIFYRCVKSFNGKYTVFRYQCGPGTVFDPDTQICNFLRNTKRSECGGIKTSLNEHLNEIVGAVSELPSPIITKAPIYAQTVLSTQYPRITTQRLNSESSSSYTWGTTAASQRPVLASEPSSHSGDICTSDGFMGDSEDCRKFYRCVSNLRGGYVRYEYSCTESTIWDDDAQTCNHPWAVQRRRCGRGNLVNKDTSELTKPNDSSMSNEIDRTQLNYGDKIPQIESSRIPITQTEYYRDPSPSHSYGSVNYGTPLMNAPVYSNYVDNSVDGKKQESDQTTTRRPHETSSLKPSLTIEYIEDKDYGYSSQANTINEKPTSQDNNNNKCTQSGFIGDTNDCSKFYRCVDNGRGGYIKYEFTCGEGTVWDSKIEACNHAWAVPDCGQKAPLQQSTTSTKSTQNYEATTETNTVTQGYHTTSTMAISITDEEMGYGNQNQPTPSNPSSTIGTSSSDIVCSSNGFIGDEKDCKKFYRCVENGKGSYTKYEFSCGDGTLWDPEIHACNHVWAVKRCGITTDINKVETTSSGEHVSMTSMSSIQTTTQKLPDIDYDQGYGKPETEKPSSTTTSKQPQVQETNNNNECKTSGFMGDSYDCKKFYRCVDNGQGYFTQYEFSCGEGTVWDSKIDACNHAWAVEKCGTNSTPDNNKETPSPILSDEEIFTSQTIESISTSTDRTTKISTLNTENIQASSSTTEKITQEGNNCTASGFMGDKNDCSKFYRCVDNGRGGFIRYEFTCGEGTVWDETIEACNHKWAVKKCGSSNNSTDTTFETTSSTSMITSEVFTEPVQETSNKPSVKPQQDSASDKPQQGSASGKPHQTTDDKICAREGFVGDSKDCRVFYRCVDNGQGSYIKYEFECGEGTVWDSEINTCNHPSPGNNCTNISSNNSTTTHSTIEPHQNENEITESLSTMPTTSNKDENSESSRSPNENMSKCEIEGFYGDLEDCKKFFRCVDNGKGGFIRYNFTCGEGTIWDQEILACNHKNGREDCSHSFSNSTTPHSVSTTLSSSTPSPPSSSSTIESSETTEIPPVSHNMCDSEGFFANSDNCRKFYRCVDNGKGSYTRYDFTCGEGTMWVQEILACDHDEGISNCSSNVVTNTTSTISESSANDHTSPTMITSSTESQKEPTQQSMIQDEEVSESNSVQSSTTEKNCEQTSESSKPDNSNSCKKEGFFGNTDDCKKFYRCVDNGKGGYTKYDFTCGEGTIWDQDLTTCNHPQDVSNPTCKQSETSSSPSGTDGVTSSSSSTSVSSESTSYSTTESSSQSSSSTTEKNSNSSDCAQENTSQKPANQNITCTKEGYYANPNDCKKFYRCVDWDGNGEKFSVYHFECGEGTIWDPALDTCNHEDSVYPPRECNGTQSQNQESPTSESTTSIQEESSTTEPSVTSNTNEAPTEASQSTTAQQTTTSDQTTIQQSTTSEQSTTQQSTTSEQSTTQQSTTSEQSTTQQSTISEQTTQQSTTSEQMTQQSTTSEQMTQQSTTSEQTTTQQSTTSEQTTTLQSTTSEQTTMQQSITSEQTTTEQSTTSDQTTTQQSTTREQSTTQQSTTSEQSTDQHSTTSEQQSTTERTTPQPTTTQQPSTTDESSTQQSTTQQTTTTEGSDSTSYSTQQTNESSTTESSESTSSSSDKCPETDEDQHVFVCPTTSFKRHPKYCNLFYQCNEDDDSHDVQIAVFRCPNNTIYDENQIKCVEESKVNKKCDGQIAQRKRNKRLDASYKEPIVVSKERLKCPDVGYFSFENEECSPVFLKCTKSKSNMFRGLVYKCPEGYLYWSVSKRCEKRNRVDFCKSSSVNNWNGRWDIPTEKRNVDL